MPRAAVIGSIAVLLALLAAGCGGTGPRTVAPLRHCGYLDWGIGWHVKATSDVSCSVARHVTRGFGYCKQGARSCTVDGYRCESGPVNGSILCVQGDRRALAIANH
jgi:hypothetical protein